MGAKIVDAIGHVDVVVLAIFSAEVNPKVLSNSERPTKAERALVGIRIIDEHGGGRNCTLIREKSRPYRMSPGKFVFDADSERSAVLPVSRNRDVSDECFEQ